MSVGERATTKTKERRKKLHWEAVSERNCCDFYWSRHQPGVPGTRKLFFRRTECVLFHQIKAAFRFHMKYAKKEGVKG